MKQRLSNTKYVLEALFWAGIGIWVAGMVLILSLWACTAKAADAEPEQKPTFCQVWDTAQPVDKTAFILSGVPKVQAALDEKRPNKKAENSIAATCMQTNAPKIIEKLDEDCRVERALTGFFKQQVDTTDQEMQSITDFVNMCVAIADQSKAS